MDSTNDILVNILFVLEWVAFIVSLVFFYKLRKWGLVFISIYLLSVVIAETVGWMIRYRYITNINSAQWFNIWVPVQFLCLLLLFHQHTRHIAWRILIRIFCGIIIVLPAAYFITSKSVIFDSRDYTISAALVSACCLYYLYECMNSKEIGSIHRNALLYTALGVLLYHLGSLLLNSVRNYYY